MTQSSTYVYSCTIKRISVVSNPLNIIHPHSPGTLQSHDRSYNTLFVRQESAIWLGWQKMIQFNRIRTLPRVKVKRVENLSKTLHKQTPCHHLTSCARNSRQNGSKGSNTDCKEPSITNRHQVRRCEGMRATSCPNYLVWYSPLSVGHQGSQRQL